MKRILGMILSMLICLSCVSVGMTAVFAEDAEYTPVVGLAPEMYSPKTVYVDDDFNNRDTTNENTDLTKIADGKTAYAYQSVMTNESGTTISKFNVASNDSGEIYAVPQGTWSTNFILKGKNDINADRVAISFKFKIDAGKSFYVLASNSEGSSDENKKLFMFQLGSTNNKWTIKYLPKDTSTMVNVSTNISSQGSDTWEHVYFELKRTLGDDGKYSVTIDKLYCTDSAGTRMNIDTSSLSPIDVNWWSGNCTESDWKNVAFVIGRNSELSLKIDDVMLYVPDDLKMKDASYDSATGNVKAVFTRGLNASMLGGITIKSGENVIAATAALDPTDTSNRTVILTPAAALDVENESYVVTASGVTDLEGNAVPEKSVIIGKLSLIVENEKYYVNDAEVTTTKLNASPGQTVAAKADVTNPTDANAEIMPIIAYYEDGVLKCVNAASTVTVNAGASAQLSASFTMPDTDGTNGEFKFFAFKDGKLSPIMGALQKERFNNESATVFLLGDSLCENFTSAARKPQTGWGQTIGSLLADNVTVKDYAYSGFSTKTYMDCENYSGNWVTRTWSSETMVNKSGETVAAKPILKEVNAGDYVIVALGKEDKNNNLAEETYKGYLKQMAADTKAKGAEIIFVTPTISTKTPLSTDPATAFTNTYDSRARMMKAAAAECGAVCLDLGTAMTEYYNTITENATTNLDTIRGYHLYQSILTKSIEDGGFGLTSTEIANHGNSTVKAGNDDAENLSSRGAEMVSRIIVTLLGSSGSNLKYYIK